MRVFLDPVAQIIAAVCSRERSVPVRLGMLGLGTVLFLGAGPWLLAWVAGPVTGWLRLTVPRVVEIAAGVAAVGAGLALLAWAVFAFWRHGHGTPVPAAAPQQLVDSGPFAWCRNPIMLGATVYYLGVGSLWISLPAGLAMFALGFALGAPYHRFVEERELRLRFGLAYDDYRRRVPFVIPRRPR